ncbi:DUF2256 domain-containing protein [Terrihabitans rhizophilus]|uniref:DUF2256 domain-containing protein n=1 Tax=Terrihabitans rhizophilus TaxID=3092662 RepID=A0ABU4RJ95_9HYPH|nr:DUF2256 domain-containing protein [Terrihabitans sp. PJ23]MDX6804923.1 DUF2256 domain-containing protein [Terrihabitans sp. PJ23]
MAKHRAKADLPSKPCECCGRPMVWRKSWRSNWEQVRYCSDKCRMRKTAAPAGAQR